MATATKDAVLASAVDQARAAAEAVADRPELVGEHLGVVVEGERLVSHRFATTAPGYVGWSWVVTVARVPRGRTATICEVDLLPGPDAVLAPPWVPWSERLQPGDLGPGDVLPFVTDDERLDQGYEATGDLDADTMAFFELGLGRQRVLSWQGRADAARRWYGGSHGPIAPVAVASSAPCSTCGFLLLLAGSLRTEFGVCANEWSPDDGRVVSMDHGCGAHSQTDVGPVPSDWPDDAPIIDELDADLDLELLPAEPDRVPVVVDEVPVVSVEVPVVVDELPAASDEVPVAVDEVPVAVDEAPVAPATEPVALDDAPVDPAPDEPVAGEE